MLGDICPDTDAMVNTIAYKMQINFPTRMNKNIENLLKI